MSADGTPEQDAILARLNPYLVSGRVYDSLPEEVELVRDDTTALVKPYILVTFGSVYPQEGDRSIEGAEQQPQIMPVIVECWAANARAARATAGAVRTRLLGWTPTPDNSSELDLRGGGWFEQKDASGRPTRYMESVNWSLTINNSFDVP